MFWIERDMQVAIRGAVQGDNATLDGGTLLNYLQPFLLIDMLPEVRIAVFSLQPYGRPSRIAKSRQQKQGDQRYQHGQRDSWGSTQSGLPTSSSCSSRVASLAD